jgi:hypothetical protein
MRPVACEPLCRRAGVVGRVGQPRRRLEAASRPRGRARQSGGPAASKAGPARCATAPVAADGVARTLPLDVNLSPVTQLN